MPRGIVDRDRPRRIALATLEVVAEKGVEGLTHRAVAVKADVPLGSTTYHFRTTDDLLAAAMVEAKVATDVELAALAKALAGNVDLPRALAEYVFDALSDNWDRTVVEMELYMAALRRPALLTLSREWDEALSAVLSRHADAATANALAVMVDGICVRALIHGMPELEEIEATLRRVALTTRPARGSRAGVRHAGRGVE